MKRTLPKFMLMYVKDPTIPKGSEANRDNQLIKEFSNRFSLWWFLLRNSAARASLLADRGVIITCDSE